MGADFFCALGGWGLIGGYDDPKSGAGTGYFGFIFFGSQTSAFFFTTAPQSLQRKRPFLGLLVDSPFLQLIVT
jgi:hypothetical protein